jgi:hypothetical protein
MLPLGPLDGNKVKDWNENAFYITISVFGILVFSWFLLGLWSPENILSTIAAWF